MKTEEEFRKDAQWLARQIFTAETMIAGHKKAIAQHRKNIKAWKNKLLALGMYGLDASFEIDYKESPSHDVEGMRESKKEE